MTDFQRLNERYLAENEHRQELIRAERMHRELLDEQRKQTSAIERQNQSHGGGWLIIGLFAILVASRTCRRWLSGLLPRSLPCFCIGSRGT